MIRHSAIDFENPFIDHEKEVYKIRQKHLITSCLGIIYSSSLFVFGYYIGYLSNKCEGSL